jgi:hypothetical protein
MWQANYRCRLEDPACLPVVKRHERHPIFGQGEPPLCIMHEEPMVLMRYTPAAKPGEQKPRPKRRKGGFNSQQMELF